MDYTSLGATLYVPGTHRDIAAICNAQKIETLRSVVLCTEDAVSDADLPAAMRNINCALRSFSDVGIFRFIRPRNPEVLASILEMPSIRAIDGFVLPKVRPDTLQAYFNALSRHRDFKVMITLETEEAFDRDWLWRLRDILVTEPYRGSVLTIRIGGLDLLNILGIRRSCSRTIYETPIGHCISQCVAIFKPCGFNLSAPAYECFDNFETLRQEVELDLLHGLFGKTAIHPSQIDVIQSAYKVSLRDIESAQALLDPASPVVFRHHDRMCEKATHVNWAHEIIKRAKIYGVSKDIGHNRPEIRAMGAA